MHMALSCKHVNIGDAIIQFAVSYQIKAAIMLHMHPNIISWYFMMYHIESHICDRTGSTTLTNLQSGLPKTRIMSSNLPYPMEDIRHSIPIFSCFLGFQVEGCWQPAQRVVLSP